MNNNIFAALVALLILTSVNTSVLIYLTYLIWRLKLKVSELNDLYEVATSAQAAALNNLATEVSQTGDLVAELIASIKDSGEGTVSPEQESRAQVIAGRIRTHTSQLTAAASTLDGMGKDASNPIPEPTVPESTGPGPAAPTEPTEPTGPVEEPKPEDDDEEVPF